MENKAIKWTKRILWSIAIILFVCGAILLIISSTNDDSLRLSAFITISISFIFILSAFLVDSVEVMMLKNTAGDEYTVKSKEALIKILEKREIDFELNQPKSYYLHLLREDDKKEKTNG